MMAFLLLGPMALVSSVPSLIAVAVWYFDHLSSQRPGACPCGICRASDDMAEIPRLRHCLFHVTPFMPSKLMPCETVRKKNHLAFRTLWSEYWRCRNLSRRHATRGLLDRPAE